VTATGTRPPKPAGNAAHMNGARPSATRSRPQPRGRLAVGAVGLLVLALAVAVFEAMVPKAPNSRAVLVATRSIRAGEVMAAGDVKAVTVASSQLAGIAASRRDRVVGQRAGLDIGAGQALVDADVGASAGPGTGEAVVGASLADGHFPNGLAAGDTVVIVDTPGSGTANQPVAATKPGPGVELAAGRVLNITRTPDGTRMNVAMVVPTSTADAVAAASASDSVSLVWVPR
jgi:hypothetical protein